MQYIFLFNLFLEARAEILKGISLAFWSKQWHLILVHQEVLHRALEQGEPGVDHAHVVPDDVPSLVLVEEQTLPRVRPNGDVGEQIPWLEVPENDGTQIRKLQDKMIRIIQYFSWEILSECRTQGRQGLAELVAGHHGRVWLASVQVY